MILGSGYMFLPAPSSKTMDKLTQCKNSPVFSDVTGGKNRDGRSYSVFHDLSHFGIMYEAVLLTRNTSRYYWV